MPRLTFKYRLYPSKTQTKVLEEQLELCRQTHNLLLDHYKQQYKEKGKMPIQFDLTYLLPTLKRLRPEFSKIYAQVLQNISKRIRDAYTGFFAKRARAKRRRKMKMFNGGEEIEVIMAE